MLKIAYDLIYAHPLPEGHSFPMLKYELIPAQLIHEGIITADNLFSPGPLDEKTVLQTHDEAYWHQRRDQTLPLKEQRRITVKDRGVPLKELNELEFIHGEIFANLWHTDSIARISPADGHILGWIDLTGLLPDAQRLTPESVLNGIAYDAAHDRIFVTGKQWPTLFEIKINPTPNPK